MNTIQQATLSEATTIAEIGITTFRETHVVGVPPQDLESYIQTKFSLNAVEDELKDPENIFHVIYFKSRPVGYSKIILNKPHPLIADPAVTKLERLYLLREFHDLKLGLTLFKFVTDLSRKQNQEGVWLFVWIENERAVSFYKKLGFQIIGSTDFKISENHSNPNHIMYLKYQEFHGHK